MWYLTLPDVLEVHERIASFQGCEARVQDRSALDRAIVAPQRVEGDDLSPEVLARKAAALMVPLVRDRPFQHCSEDTAFALVAVFLDRNGASFQATLDDMGELFYQIADGSMGTGRLATWIEQQLERRFSHEHLHRLLGSLDRLAKVIEDLDGRPRLRRHVHRLDGVGNAVCLELTTLFALGERGRETVRNDYPAVHEQWGEIFDP